MSLQNLPAEYYDGFLSTLAKERKPNPSKTSYHSYPLTL